MKVLLAGAFGNLGFELLKCLIAEGHEVVAADLKEKETTDWKANIHSVPSMPQTQRHWKVSVTDATSSSPQWVLPAHPQSLLHMTLIIRET